MRARAPTSAPVEGVDCLLPQPAQVGVRTLPGAVGLARVLASSPPGNGMKGRFHAGEACTGPRLATAWLSPERDPGLDGEEKERVGEQIIPSG